MPTPRFTNADVILVRSPRGCSPAAYAAIKSTIAIDAGEDFTFEFYLYAEESTAPATLATVEIASQPQPLLELAGSASKVALVVGQTELAADTAATGWHLYSVTCSQAQGVNLYVDSELVAASADAISGTRAQSGQWQLNTYALGAAYARLWKGARSEEQIAQTESLCAAPYDPALLTFAELTQLPASDPVNTTTTVQLINGAAYRVETQGLGFPDAGSSASVQCLASEDLLFPGTAPFTIESWFRCTSLPTSGLGVLASRYQAPGGIPAGYMLGIDPSGAVVGNRQGVPITSATHVALGEWTHAALVYDGSALRILVNGVEDMSTTSSADNTCAASLGLVLGAPAEAEAGLGQFKGTVSEVRFWSSMRNAAQIVEQMGGHPILEPDMVAYYEFDEAAAGDLTGVHPPVTLTSVGVVAVQQELTVEDVAAFPPLPRPGPVEITPQKLQAELAKLRAAMEPISVPEESVDPEWLAAVDQEHGLVRLSIEDGHLVLHDAADPDGPPLLRARDAGEDYTLWWITIALEGVGIVIEVFGLKVSTNVLANYAIKQLRNRAFISRLTPIRRTVTTWSLVEIVISLRGNMLGLLWEIVKGISWWTLLRFVAGLTRFATPAGFMIVLAGLAFSILTLISRILTGPPNSNPEEILRIRMFQAGHGDAILISSANKYPEEDAEFDYILVDGGPAGTYPTIASRVPAQLDIACVTHVDSDHIAGMIELFSQLATSNREVGQLLFNPPGQAPPTVPQSTWQEVFDANGRVRHDALPSEFDEDARFELGSWAQGQQLAKLSSERQVQVVPTKTGSTQMSLGGVSIEFGGPQPYNISRYNKQEGPYGETANRESIIFTVRSGKPGKAIRMLMTGDAWDRLDPDKSPPAPPGTTRTDIRGNRTPGGCRFPFMKVPHHGSASLQPPMPPEKPRSADQNFYANYLAENYLISARPRGNHELPALFALRSIVEGNIAAGHANYCIYCTNQAPAIQTIANDPRLRPSVARYRLYVLNAGADLFFELVNGVIKVRPQSGLGGTVTEIDPY